MSPADRERQHPPRRPPCGGLPSSAPPATTIGRPEYRVSRAGSGRIGSLLRQAATSDLPDPHESGVSSISTGQTAWGIAAARSISGCAAGRTKGHQHRHGGNLAKPGRCLLPLHPRPKSWPAASLLTAGRLAALRVPSHAAAHVI